MEKHPIYALKGLSVNDAPLGLFTPERYGAVLESEYGIPRRSVERSPRAPLARRRQVTLLRLQVDYSELVKHRGRPRHSRP